MPRLASVFSPRDRAYFAMFEEAGQNVLRASALLDRMLSNYPVTVAIRAPKAARHRLARAARPSMGNTGNAPMVGTRWKDRSEPCEATIEPTKRVTNTPERIVINSS